MNIRFRVWSKSANSWVKDNPTDEKFGVFGPLNTLTNSFSKGDLIFQLSTGMKDANGSEIFDGDIVWASYDFPFDKQSWDDSKRIYQVFWKKANYGGKFGPELVRTKDGFCELYGEWPQQADIQVVGNIFENPELLSGK